MIITSSFGQRIRAGNREFHDGVDISMPPGSPVYPLWDGTVFSSTLDPVLGRMITVLHDNGYTTLYGHLAAILVHGCDEVKTDFPIARSGGIAGLVGSGNSTGPHLHLSVYNTKTGKAVDPLPFLRNKNRTLFIAKHGILEPTI